MFGNAASEANGGDGDPEASARWHSLSPQAVRIWRFRATAGAGIWLGAVWSAALIARASIRRPPLGTDITLVATVASAFVVVGWVTVFVVAKRRFRGWRWAVHDHRLIVEYGWWRERRLHVPVDDVHTLDVKAGPLLRRWGVHQVRVFASGPIGSVTIPVLADNAVAALRHDLGFDEYQLDEQGCEER